METGHQHILGGGVKSGGCTLDPGNTSANIALSNGNLTATLTLADLAWYASFGTVGVSSGSHSFDVTVDVDAGSRFIMIGISNSSGFAEPRFWFTTNGFSYHDNNGRQYYNDTAHIYGAGYTTGAVITVDYDADTGTLEFFRDSISQGVAQVGLTGEWFPAIALAGSTVGGQVTLDCSGW
jgi:hypothetical protein